MDSIHIQASRVRLGMNPRSVQRLVDVDVPKSGEKALIEQQGLDLSAVPLQGLHKPAWLEIIG